MLSSVAYIWINDLLFNPFLVLNAGNCTYNLPGLKTQLYLLPIYLLPLNVLYMYIYVLYLLPLSTFSLDPHPFPGTAIPSLPLSSLKVNRPLIQWVATAESCPSPSQSITRGRRQGTSSEQELLISLRSFISSTKVKLTNFCTHRFFAQSFKRLDFIP